MLTVRQPHAHDQTLAEAILLCTVLHGEGQFGLMYMWRDRLTQMVTDVSHSFGTFGEQVATLTQRAIAGWEPYVLTAVTSEAGHKREFVVESWAVAADFDDGFPEVLELNELVRPTFVVNTSPGRYHAVWVLDAACTPSQMLYLAAVIHDRFDADPAFARTNQAIRLPGFLNAKNDHKVKLLPLGDAKKLHSFDVLCQAFDATKVDPSVKTFSRRV